MFGSTFAKSTICKDDKKMRFVVCVLFLTLFRKVLTSDGKIETEGRFPRLIIVTPTYARVSQAMHITNLVNVLRIVPPPVYWIVVETYKVLLS